MKDCKTDLPETDTTARSYHVEERILSSSIATIGFVVCNTSTSSSSSPNAIPNVLASTGCVLESTWVAWTLLLGSRFSDSRARFSPGLTFEAESVVKVTRFRSRQSVREEGRIEVSVWLITSDFMYLNFERSELRDAEDEDLGQSELGEERVDRRARAWFAWVAKMIWSNVSEGTGEGKWRVVPPEAGREREVMPWERWIEARGRGRVRARTTCCTPDVQT